MNAIIIDDDDSSREVLSQLIKQVDKITLIGIFRSGTDALAILNTGDVHLVFLDVEMPEMNGLEFLSSLETRPEIIVTTSHKKYAVEAFDYDVVDYLIKPITFPRFVKAVIRAQKSQEKALAIAISVPKNINYFFVKSDFIMKKILVQDTLWIESVGDYVKIHTLTKDYLLHITLKSIENKLPAGKFARVHRSYIVQLDNVKNLQEATIFMMNDERIPLGPNYKEALTQKLNFIS